MFTERTGLASCEEVASPLRSARQMTERCIEDRSESHNRAMGRIGECQPSIVAAAELVTETLAAGRTIYTLGNGGSAAEAQHFAAELVGRFKRQRRAFPVLALTTDSSILTAVGNDYCFDDVFSRQVEAFARDGDLLIAFSTSGESRNTVRAALVARQRGASVIAMTGQRRSSLAELADVTVQVPSDDTPTIQEIHNLLTHVLCDVAESCLTNPEGR